MSPESKNHLYLIYIHLYLPSNLKAGQIFENIIEGHKCSITVFYLQPKSQLDTESAVISTNGAQCR